MTMYIIFVPTPLSLYYYTGSLFRFTTIRDKTMSVHATTHNFHLQASRYDLLRLKVL